MALQGAFSRMEVGLQALIIHFTRLEQLLVKMTMASFAELCFRWTCTQGSLAFHALEVQQIGQKMLLSLGKKISEILQAGNQTVL